MKGLWIKEEEEKKELWKFINYRTYIYLYIYIHYIYRNIFYNLCVGS